MSETFKFPRGGKDVTIVRKQDIINCIEENIIDKDIALALIEQLEIDINHNLSERKWTGIPFIGSLKLNGRLEVTNALNDIKDEAKVQFEKETYVLFKKNLATDLVKRDKYERFSKYITSMAANKYKNKYKRMCRVKGTAYTNFYMFLTNFILAVENEQELIY